MALKIADKIKFNIILQYTITYLFKLTAFKYDLFLNYIAPQRVYTYLVKLTVFK
jgi:hypothetical protein